MVGWISEHPTSNVIPIPTITPPVILHARRIFEAPGERSPRRKRWNSRVMAVGQGLAKTVLE